jgi:uncharacterized membrane protein YgcG
MNRGSRTASPARGASRTVRDIRQAAGGQAQAAPDQRADPPPLSVWATLGNCLLVAVMSVVILCGAAFWAGSLVMVNVLDEIGQRDYSGPMRRKGKYEDVFDALRKRGCAVEQDNPRMTVAGVTTYLWVVQPQGSDERVQFQWTHDLQTNEISPQTNGALLLDLQLGYVELGKAQRASFYNPADQAVIGLLQGGAVTGPPAPGAPAAQPQTTAALPPLISPEEAKGRAARARPKEEEPAAGEQPADGGAGDAVQVPPDEGGGGTPPSDGGDGGGGTPPSDGGGNGGGDGGGGSGGGGNGGGEAPPVVPPEGGGH